MVKFSQHQISQIEINLLGDFEKSLFSAAMYNLNDKDNVLRFNNFAYTIRELSRHILIRLAPDDSVLNCSWYKKSTDKENGITRRQRAYFSVQGGLSDTYIKDVLDIKVDDTHGELISAIDKLSKFTHIQPESIGLSENKVNILTEKTLNAIAALFSLISDCRDSIIKRLQEHINTSVVEETVSNGINGLDIYSTHQFIDDIYVEEVKIADITDHLILFKVNGHFDSQLQWGSNSDLRRGDGATIDRSIPFVCDLNSPVDYPNEVTCQNVSVDEELCNWFGE